MQVEPAINADSIPMGANIVADRSGTTFRCWAPRAKRVAVRGSFNHWGNSDPGWLFRDGDYWSGFIGGVTDGATYKFYVEGHGTSGYKRDPYARELTREPAYPICDCVVRDPRNWTWIDDNYKPPPFHDLILYQLHVGVFNGPDREKRPAKFLDLLGKLDYLMALGVNGLQLLPVIEFASERSLGYEGFDIFSPEMDYAVAPEELPNYMPLINGLRQRNGAPPLQANDLVSQCNQFKAVIELFHLYGIAVLIDVVYNHAGGQMTGQDESIWFFDRVAGTNHNDSLYFTDQDHAGPVWAVWKQEVRQFLIDNAVFFLQEYRVDGIRYDQASVIVRQNVNDGWKFCQDLTGSTAFARPSAIDVAEFWGVDPYVVRFREHGGAGFDACWHDGLRRAVRGAVASASAGGNAQVDMTAIGGNLWAPGFLNAWRAIQYLESHDEVYRERDGQRVPRLADGGNPRSWYARSRARVASGILLTAPGIPMLFMGQEFLEDKQWADDAGNHQGLLIWWDGLDWGKDPHMGRFHRFMEELVWLRRTQSALRGEALNVLHVNNNNRVLAFHRWIEGEGRDIVVVASLNDHTLPSYELPWPMVGRWREIFNSEAYDEYVPDGNLGWVDARSEDRDGFPAVARLRVPANSLLIFAR